MTFRSMIPAFLLFLALGACGSAVQTVPATPVAGPTASAAAHGDVVTGELRPGDAQLRSGEYVDTYSFRFAAGSRIHIEAQSDDFDTYLIVRSPDGQQFDLDDGLDGVDAVGDLTVGTGGDWTVMVTSYRPGETGRYRLTIEG